MANNPFKNATFTTSGSDASFLLLQYGAVYYTKINGVITAIKPIAQGFHKDTEANDCQWKWKLRALAADGKVYNLDLCGRRLFPTANDAIAYEKNTGPTYRSPISQRTLPEVFAKYGAQCYRNAILTWVWSEQSGSAHVCEGGYIFWADKDGEHVEFEKTTKDGRKLYLSKEACVLDNVKVLEFTEDTPAPKGEYTIVRDFTVKADSEEEAAAIIDNAIMKAYKQQ